MNDNTEYIIREETENDYTEIYRLIQTAFETAEVKDGDEQDYAVQLRESENYIPALALVAEKGGKLMGHIMFTRIFIQQDNGDKMKVLLVSPLSVLLEYRNKGIGAALMKEGLKIATRLGYKAAFLCGNPDYYTRLGYNQISDVSFWYNNQQIPEQYVLCYELEKNILSGIKGRIDT